MRFGFQISISGGFSKVVNRAKITNCETIQLFSRNPRKWESKILDENEVEKFKNDIKLFNIFPVFIHMPYLPNIASPDDDLFKKSVNLLCDDLIRAEKLSAYAVVTHIGNSKSNTIKKAIERVADAINIAFSTINNSVLLLLETTAGQGTEIGCNFYQISEIINKIENKDRIGVCIDTAHIFEAGYNISTKEGLEFTLDEFDKYIGLNKLLLIHLNDSKTPLGSRKDRHEHIGKGHIGLAGFKNIIHHKKLTHLPAILETPRVSDLEDIENMQVVRKIYEGNNT